MTPLPTTTAERLLDAQVAWVVSELSGERLPAVLAREVDELLAVADDVPLADVASVETVLAVVDRLVVVPSGPGAATVATAVADELHDGPGTPVTPAGLLERAQVAALVEAALPLRPLVRRSLDRLTEAPTAGTLASRFVTRLVVDVLEANRSMTSRIPGLGGIVSMGTSAATRMVGVADKQVQALLGDTAGRGAALAVRRLNNVVMATLDDPDLPLAATEVWDHVASDPVDGLGDLVDRDDLHRLAAVLRDALATAVGSEPARDLVAGLARRLLAEHGDRPVADVLRDTGLDRDDLVAVAAAVVRPVVATVAADGTLARVVRARLEPFYRSPEVAAILADAAEPAAPPHGDGS